MIFKTISLPAIRRPKKTFVSVSLNRSAALCGVAAGRG